MDRFLSAEGRLGRLGFLVRLAILAAIAGAVFAYALDYFDHHHTYLKPLGYFVGIVASLFCGLAGFMQLLKRLRDAALRPYWCLLLLVPGVNVLFLVYALAAPPRTPSESEGGAAPSH